MSNRPLFVFVVRTVTVMLLMNKLYLTFTIDHPGPRDCNEIKALAKDKPLSNGLYRIWPEGWTTVGSFQAYCDMNTDGGGWTIVQRRHPNVSRDFFNKTWNDYKNGFGDVHNSFWIGNDRLFAITNQDAYELRIELKTSIGTEGYAKYETFWVENEDQLYKLHIKKYSGNIGDSFSDHDGWLFSTKDRDNDSDDEGNCALTFLGGWWFTSCHYCHLNGLSMMKNNSKSVYDVIWNTWKGSKPIVFTEMKIRPSHFVFRH